MWYCFYSQKKPPYIIQDTRKHNSSDSMFRLPVTIEKLSKKVQVILILTISSDILEFVSFLGEKSQLCHVEETGLYRLTPHFDQLNCLFHELDLLSIQIRSGNTTRRRPVHCKRMITFDIVVEMGQQNFCTVMQALNQGSTEETSLQ
jgi:hypothetical protein